MTVALGASPDARPPHDPTDGARTPAGWWQALNGTEEGAAGGPAGESGAALGTGQALPGHPCTVVGDAGALAVALAERVAEAARRAAASRGVFRIALAGGSTPEAAYERLSRMSLPWSAVEVFWGDERPVPPDHPDSNYRMAHQALLSRVPIPARQVHRMRGEAKDLEEAAAGYALELADAFGIAGDGPPPRIDLVLLGMGAEGHTASLFPDSPALRADAWVAAPFVPQLGMRRLTLTPRVINRAASIIFAVGGVNKAAALRAVLRGPTQPERYPAQVVAPEDGRLEWLVDEALAERAGLTDSGGGR